MSAVKPIEDCTFGDTQGRCKCGQVLELKEQSGVLRGRLLRAIGAHCRPPDGCGTRYELSETRSLS